MVKRSRRAALDVFINESKVGTLVRESDGALKFAYDRDAIDSGAVSVVSYSLPLREEAFSGDVVLNVFENLLPDSTEIRERIAARKKAKGKDAFSILSEIGRDCVGALQFLPEGSRPNPRTEAKGTVVDDARIENILANLAEAPLGMDEDDEDFRISIAGAQEKTALLRQGGQWLLPHGTTPTTHIFKKPMPLRSDGVDLRLSCENEHFCLTFLRELGLRACKSELITFGEQKAIVIERFDRFSDRNGVLRRRHQEDMCQALSVPSNRKYQKDGGPGFPELFRLLRGSDEVQADQRQLLTCMVVFWLLAASDGHAKNYSIFLAPDGRFKLTPIYDVMSIEPIFAADQIPEHKVRVAMSIGAKKHYIIRNIVLRHFEETAVECGISNASLKEVFDFLIERSAAALDKTVAAMPAGFPPQIAEPIVEGYRHRLMLLKELC